MSTQTTAASSPLREVRLARGLTLAQVAGRAGMTMAHLSRVERGEKQLSVGALHRVAGALGLDDVTHALAPYVVAPR